MLKKLEISKKETEVTAVTDKLKKNAIKELERQKKLKTH